MKKLTLERLKHTDFEILYEKFIVNKGLTNDELFKILQISVILINCTDKYIKELGYRIIVIFANKYRCYEPLYEIAMNEGMYPIAYFIQHITKRETLHSEINSILLDKYKKEKNKVLTREQKGLNDYYNANGDKNIAVIAPTSYGKTELILETIKGAKGKNVVIITPSKALLNQTRNRIYSNKPEWLNKVVVYPEMYSREDENIIAVLTQERLLRLLKENPELKFDIIIVDEAHDMLLQDDRTMLLASSIIILQKRNKDTIFKFLTPFLKDRKNLELKYTKYNVDGFNITEKLKTEKYYVYNTRIKEGLKFYDQYFNKFYDIESDKNLSCQDFIIQNAADKNIIYFNRPYDIENFAISYANQCDEVQDDEIEKVCKNLESYLDSNYNLIYCLKRGIVYHHGSMPENIRYYLENLYVNNDNLKYIVTSSTLMEGVNIPASKIFIMDNCKGKGYLIASDFKNLTGRICRFSDIFNDKNSDLVKLEPEIYFVIGEYYKKNVNIENYIKKTARANKEISDTTTNVLLKNVNVESDLKELKKSKEFIENYEQGTIKDYDLRLAKTEVGKSCFSNNIVEFDIINHEDFLQPIIDDFKRRCIKIDNTQLLLDLINSWFIQSVETISNDNFERLKNIEAIKFYKMVLDWKLKNASYKEMIHYFFKYWKDLKNNGCYENLTYVGSKWGEETRGGFRKLWVNVNSKSDNELINLAIVRIKEEQDFLEYGIMKFVEVFNDLGLMEDNFYNKLKYGTNNLNIICLMKNGLSYYLSKNIVEDYFDFVDIDLENNTVLFKSEVIEEMKNDDANEILIFELEQFIK